MKLSNLAESVRLNDTGPASSASVKVIAESMDFDDPQGSLRRFVNLAKGEAILVRPDGHVAATIPSSKANALAEMLPLLVGKALFKETVA